MGQRLLPRVSILVPSAAKLWILVIQVKFDVGQLLLDVVCKLNARHSIQTSDAHQYAYWTALPASKHYNSKLPRQKGCSYSLTTFLIHLIAEGA